MSSESKIHFGSEIVTSSGGRFLVVEKGPGDTFEAVVLHSNGEHDEYAFSVGTLDPTEVSIVGNRSIGEISRLMSRGERIILGRLGIGRKIRISRFLNKGRKTFE